MLAWLGKRLALSIPVVLGVVTISFLLMRLSPGDPARLALGERAPQSAVDALREKWGLDASRWEQYITYLGSLVRGDLGESLYFRSSITDLMAQRLPVTVALMFLAAFFATAITVPLALRASSKPGGIVDHIARVANAVLQGAPAFFVGALLILLLGIRFPIFPAGGYPASVEGRALALVLPALTIALGIIPLLYRGLRAAMAEAQTGEYVAFARSKGLPESNILRRYVLRNASITGVSILGIQVGALASGSLVVEQVFAIPGMGSMLMTGILNRDYQVVQACTLVFGLLVVVAFLITDFTYAKLDPRMRLS